MCGRYSQVTDAELTAEKYDAHLSIGHMTRHDMGWDGEQRDSQIAFARERGLAPLVLPNYNVSHSNASIIIQESDDHPRIMVKAIFGYEKKMGNRKLSPLNARCEGKKGRSPSTKTMIQLIQVHLASWTAGSGLMYGPEGAPSRSTILSKDRRKNASRSHISSVEAMVLPSYWEDCGVIESMKRQEKNWNNLP